MWLSWELVRNNHIEEPGSDCCEGLMGLNMFFRGKEAQVVQMAGPTVVCMQSQKAGDRRRLL